MFAGTRADFIKMRANAIANRMLENVSDGGAGKPAIVVRNDVLRRNARTGLLENFFVNFHILVPMLAVFDIIHRKFPFLFRSLDSLQQLFALLIFRQIQKKLERVNAVVEQVFLKIVDVAIAFFHKFLPGALLGKLYCSSFSG